MYKYILCINIEILYNWNFVIHVFQHQENGTVIMKKEEVLLRYFCRLCLTSMPLVLNHCILQIIFQYHLDNLCLHCCITAWKLVTLLVTTYYVIFLFQWPILFSLSPPPSKKEKRKKSMKVIDGEEIIKINILFGYHWLDIFIVWQFEKLWTVVFSLLEMCTNILQNCLPGVLCLKEIHTKCRLVWIWHSAMVWMEKTKYKRKNYKQLQAKEVILISSLFFFCVFVLLFH